MTLPRNCYRRVRELTRIAAQRGYSRGWRQGVDDCDAVGPPAFLVGLVMGVVIGAVVVLCVGA